VSAYEICLAVLLLGGLAPVLLLASRGEPDSRLIGLDLVGPGQSYDLILPLVLVPLSFAGTLVFTRLLSGRGEENE
jgi:multisubunit Na+/H+ antiporter MnhF subunit